MINGVRVRDSGVELSPTGTDRRGGPRTASNRTVRASSAIAAGSTRWLMRRTKRPLSASLEEWPVLAATPIYKDLPLQVDFEKDPLWFVANIYPASPGGIGAPKWGIRSRTPLQVAGQLGTRPPGHPMATFLFPRG